MDLPQQYVSQSTNVNKEQLRATEYINQPLLKKGVIHNIINLVVVENRKRKS